MLPEMVNVDYSVVQSYLLRLQCGGVRIDEIDRQPCSMAKAMAEIGDAWSLLILREAFYGRRRFSDFVANTGAQKTVVSARLKALVDVGILERVEYSEHPTRHHYVLTEKGRALAPVEQAIGSWRQFVGARTAYQRLGALLEDGAVSTQRLQLP